MGKRASHALGTFCWVDLATTDPGGAKEFYAGLFGWEYEDLPLPEGGAYTMAKVQGDQAAAISAQPEQQREAGVPPNWFNYVSVASADESARRAGELGGTVHAGPFDVMEAGRMAVIADPAGAMFGAWQAGRNYGAERVNDPGCLTWNELATNDPYAAEGFYSGLFDWRFEKLDTGGPAYWIIQHKGAAAGRNGGMRELAPEQAQLGIPPHWMPYFTARSTDEAVATADRLGGATMAGPIDLPQGRIAIIRDPQGAVFGVFEGDVDD